MKVLWLGESLPDPGMAKAGALRFRFDDGLAGGEPAGIPVSAELRPLRVSFATQVLNHPLARQALRARPDWIYVRGLYGCTLDLPRVAKLLGVPVCLELLDAVDIDATDGRTMAYVSKALASADLLVMPAEVAASLPGGLDVAVVRPGGAAAAMARMLGGQAADRPPTDYARYEFCLRDHPLLVSMQRAYVDHFRGCQRVLDLGCGAGIFLELLASAGIPAQGVERDPVIAEYARAMGLDVATSDALDFLRGHPGAFDGIYCSHFVEHLAYPAVQELMGLAAAALKPDGVLVMVFPDPESIRSQLLGFWRDPEHVRFYHPDLVELVAGSHGLACEWSSLRERPHEVGPFPLDPPEVMAADLTSAVRALAPVPAAERWWQGALRRVGLAPDRRLRALEGEVARLNADLANLARAAQAQMSLLEQRTTALWRVNRTWAWDDNAVLRFRKAG